MHSYYTASPLPARIANTVNELITNKRFCCDKLYEKHLRSNSIYSNLRCVLLGSIFSFLIGTRSNKRVFSDGLIGPRGIGFLVLL